MAMEYDMPLYRPPSEADSLIIQATHGCSANDCTFCYMYKGKKFRIRRVAEVKADIDWCARQWTGVTRVFLAEDDPAFLAPGDMPGRIRDHCARTGEQSPVDQAAVARCVLESLALKYRQTIELLEAVTGSRPPAIHVVGGGALNHLLCQWTADATGLPVVAGPVEAAEIGNLAVQVLAIGELASIEEARELVCRSFTTQTYEPRAREPWDEAYTRLEQAKFEGSELLVNPKCE